ncbi:TMV resistance protein N-like [Prunus avium]|uniref:TMV resistance protein N-like n=2 Tax=Prunus TaxID=3754 RepID=A0A6P5RW28_PRUAV|nr:TMV resistance protein N-like [Prunus avium]
MGTRTAHRASSSSSSFSSKQHWMYDVFLSFRGEDTRNSFTGHLYMALREAGINAFFDDNELSREEYITAKLVTAIQGSRISVIVFSRRYAESSWCLDELVKIMECRTTLGQTVMPIFYDIDPSDVREQRGSFAQAFEKHEENLLLGRDNKVVRWRAALIEAANLSGWDLRNTADGYEAKFIREIIEGISRWLLMNETISSVVDYAVGLNSRVQDLSNYLDVGSDDVRIVGILGMGGIGKTTLARAIYNQFYHSFEGKSFLLNVRETAKKPNGLKRMQEQILSDILKPTKIGRVDINVLKTRLRCRRVLIIIDDVDHKDQLNALATNRDSFGPGSRIIITTRDKHLLELFQVDKIYHAQEMNEEEALELFSWHAFKNNRPNAGYFKLSKCVVAYCGGLPLALEVLGSFLFRRSTREWKSTLDKLRKIPAGDIQKQLKISFDGLSDDKERDIFLDISCFFIGMNRNYVTQILDGCGFFPEIGLSVLIERCLITVSEENKLMMHDLLRDMGREIVYEESLNDPRNCSRLWHSEDVTDVLKNESGTEEIQGVTLNLLRSEKATFSTHAFTNMKKLRLLKLNYVELTGEYKYLSRKLRWLCWHGFPLKIIPNDFDQQNLVAMDLRYSNLRHVWKDSEGWNSSGGGGLYLPGNDIPEWFTYVNEGDEVSFEVPQVSGCNLKALTVCTVYKCLQEDKSKLYISIFVTNHSNCTSFLVQPTYPYTTISHEVIWQGHLSNKDFNLEGGDFIEVCVAFGSGHTVKKIGVSLLWDKFIYDTDSFIECKSVPYAYFLRDDEDDDEEYDEDDDDGPRHPYLHRASKINGPALCAAWPVDGQTEPEIFIGISRISSYFSFKELLE